jgi:hypothetical protein
MLKPGQRKRASEIFSVMRGRILKEIDAGEDPLAMCLGVAALAKLFIASSPLAKPAPPAIDQKVDAVLNIPFGEALLGLRAYAKTEGLRDEDADAERDRLLKFFNQRVAFGVDATTMSVAVVTLAAELAGSSLYFRQCGTNKEVHTMAMMWR